MIFRSLYLFEARRMALSPIPWIGALLCLGLRLYATWDQLPDMNVDPISTSGTMLLLAVAMMLTANLATSRDTRGGMPETLSALYGRAPDRTSATTLAAMTVGTAFALSVMAVYLLTRLTMGPVAGVFDPFEALAGVLAVPFAAALGAALGRWTPWLVTVPVAAFLLAAFTYLNSNQSGYGDWFLPVVLFHGPDWPARPSALHLVYLLAAVALLAALALLRHGIRPFRLVTALTAVAVAVPAGAFATTRAPGAEINDRYEALRTPQEIDIDARVKDRYLGPGARECRLLGSVTYCAFKEYAAWIPVWAAAVGPVVEALPPAERYRVSRVQQTTDTWMIAADFAEPYITTFMFWGGAENRAQLAAQAIRRALGWRNQRQGGCDGRDQSRTVVGLWLLGQVVQPGESNSRAVRVGSNIFVPEHSPLGRIQYGAAELGYARRLLAIPDARERIWANWDALIKPSATVDQALPLLGLRPEFAAEQRKGGPCS